MTRTTDDKKEDAKQKAERLAKDMMLQQGNPGKLEWGTLATLSLSYIQDRVEKETGTKITKDRMYQLFREASREYEEKMTAKIEDLIRGTDEKLNKYRSTIETQASGLRDYEISRAKDQSKIAGLEEQISKLEEQISKILSDWETTYVEIFKIGMKPTRDLEEKQKKLESEHRESEEKHRKMEKEMEGQISRLQGHLSKESESVEESRNRIRKLESGSEAYRELLIYMITSVAVLAAYLALHRYPGLPAIGFREIPALIWLPSFFFVFLLANILIEMFIARRPLPLGVVSMGIALAAPILLDHFIPALSMNSPSEILLWWVIPAFTAITFAYVWNLVHRIPTRNPVAGGG